MTDTADTPLNVADDAAVVTPPVQDDRGLGGSLAFLVASALLFAGGLALFLVPLPLLVLEPGNTFETEDLIEVEGAEAFDSPGEVSFVTVHQRSVAPIDWLISQLQDSDEIFHEDELLQGRSLDEQREENAQLMVTSQNTAIAAALNELGFETAEPAGAVIIDVVEGGQLAGVLARNDVITEANGLPISTADELFELLSSLDESATVTLVAGRPGEDSQVVEVSLTDDTSGFLGVSRSATVEAQGNGAVIDGVVAGGPVEDILEAGDRVVEVDGQGVDSFEALVEALSGRRSGDQINLEAIRVVQGVETSVVVDVALGTRAFERAGLVFADTQFRDADLPVGVGFATNDIGGPSAGLAFTLTVLDVLTDGDLTGGANIVVTGAVDRFGNVGSIGGAHQKAFAAQASDADVFIVPDANLEEARAAVPELRVESVASVGEALELIAEFGGNADELPTNGQL